MKSPNGLNDLPIDSVVDCFGFGAEPKRCVVLSKQRDSDATYMVGTQGDTGNVQRIHPDDIVKVLKVAV